MSSARYARRMGMAALSLWLGLSFPIWSHGRESSRGDGEGDNDRLRLQRIVATRDYQGKPVEGEERTVAPLDSLWRILILEKGLSERNFQRYLVLVGALNPQLKDLNLLPLGSVIFIPARPDEILGGPERQPRRYRVKRGDYVYKIFREELGIQENRELETALVELKRLNPPKKNWDLLLAGEILVLPGMDRSEAQREVSGRPVVELTGTNDPRKIPVRTNLDLLEQVVNALGSEMKRTGEELLPLQDASIRMDRSAYPIVVNPKKDRKVILDLGGTIPPSLRARLEGRNSPLPVLSLEPRASLHEAVNGLILRLGFQPLPAGRPIVLQDHGVGIHVKGEWVAAAPEDGGGQQPLWILHLTSGRERTPHYLREYLSARGLNLKEIALPDSPLSAGPRAQGAPALRDGEVEIWPRDKEALVDAFLQSYPVSVAEDHPATLALREGIRMDIKIDRLLDMGGRRFAVFFRTIGEEAKRALARDELLTPIDLDLGTLTARELIAQLAAGLGEKEGYREHRFSANEGPFQDGVVLTVTGFFFSPRSLFVTDVEIPKSLQRFFFDRGLRIVYF